MYKVTENIDEKLAGIDGFVKIERYGYVSHEAFNLCFEREVLSGMKLALVIIVPSLDIDVDELRERVDRLYSEKEAEISAQQSL